MLRLVKKCLSALTPPDGLPTKLVVEHYKKVCVCVCVCMCVLWRWVELVQSISDIFPQVLVEIGDHIQECIKSYKVEEEMVLWRRCG